MCGLLVMVLMVMVKTVEKMDLFEDVHNNTKRRFGFSVCVVAYNRGVDEFRRSFLVDESGDTRTVMYWVNFNSKIF